MKKFCRVTALIISVIILSTLISNINVFAYDEISSLDDIDISKFNFPVVSVVTENGAPILNKEDYVNCTVAISNTDDIYCLSETIAGIRYRGNSTFTQSPKKAYRFKFEKKQDLFGMGKAKSWVLLANSFDKTMVKNAIAFNIAQQLGLEYSSKYQFVNVYLNKQYLGLYLLCEQTQTGENRVEIEEDETFKVDTGYLVEFVGNGDSTEEAYFLMNEVPTSLLATGVTTNWRKNVMKCYLQTPEKEFCSQEQINYISGYTNDFNKAILSHDWVTFNQLCDVESFVKFFIVNTVMNNGDGGYQLYFYKKENGGKVYAGPVWDFDQSAGGTTQSTSDYRKWYYGSSNPWFDSFALWDDFMDLARQYYTDNKDEIQGIISKYTIGFYEQNKYDFIVNDVKWKSVTSDYWRITPEISGLKTYEANFNQLNTWFGNRISWLDSHYHNLGAYVYNNDETCISEGTESAHCADCDFVATRVVKNTLNPDKHTFTNYVYNNDGTCLDDGTLTAKCDLCDATDTKPDPAHTAKGSHTFTNYVYNNDGTCLANGTMTAKCDLCDATDTKPDPAHTAKGNHTFTNYVHNNDATCLIAGTLTAKCDDCDATDTKTDPEYVAKDSHTFTNYVYNNDCTCLVDGTMTAKCDYCDATDTKTDPAHIAKGSHTFTNYVYNNDCTCLVDGTMTAKCDLCDATDTKPDAAHIAKGSHTFTNYVYNNDGTCLVDGTMTAKCDFCDATDTKTDPAHIAKGSHTFTNYVYNNDGTCFKDGTMTAKCDFCSATDTKPDSEHTAKNMPHTFSEYIYNKDATKEADGTKTAICSVCGYKDTVTAPGTKLPVIEIKDTSTIFTDINANSWYKEYVDYAYSYKFLKGMSEGAFEPNTSLTRGMFVTVIARIAGIDTSGNYVITKFSDVLYGKYYANAVKWATENGIVKGITDNSFEPDTNISREQMCAILVRYADTALITLKTDLPMVQFADDAMIHKYARDAVYACQRAGIINGVIENGNSFFKPDMTATRAQASKILCIFSKDYIPNG